MKWTRSAYLSSVLVGQLALWSGPLHAQANARDKAAAETLFQRAAELMDRQRYTEACEKFEASQTLEQALGTMLHLADCYDEVGRTASAWALFVQVAELSRADKQPEREAIAAARARDLFQRLSRLRLRMGENEALSELTLELNESKIPPASWDVLLPVDPGLQKVRVSAAGHEAWTTTLQMPAVGNRTLDIPRLRPVRLARQSPNDVPRLAPESSTSVQRLLGYVSGGAGLIGVGAASVFGYRAYDLNQESLEQCSRADANACTAAGKGYRDDAESAARAATVAGVAGGVLLAAGITLILTAPDPKKTLDQSARVSLRASGSADRATVALTGRF